MKQKEAKADLGVPEHEGWPEVADLGVFPMSSTFDADLAKANLMRVRADFRRAEEICMAILKTYPNSAATHTLLGDICSDRGMLEQAAHWYELSLDLDPNSLADQQKLEDVRAQIAERDHISSVAQLGLPDEKTVKSVWIAAGAIGLFVVAVALGFTIRFGHIGNSKEPQVVQTPIQAMPENVPAQAASSYIAAKPASTSFTNPTSNDEPGAVPTVNTTDEQDLQQSIANKSKYGDHLISLVQDPRTKVALMTYIAGPKDDERVIGTDLVKTLFEISDDQENVTIRCMRFEKLIYMADISRDRYNETLTDTWQQNNPDPDAWIAYILTNEWPVKPGTNASSPPSSSSKDGGDDKSANASAPPASAPPTTASNSNPSYVLITCVDEQINAP